MAVGLSNGFNQGTNTNTIAAADPGNENKWDLVTIGAGGALVYDNTHINSGTLSAKVTTGGAGVTFRWSTQFGTQTDHYGRLYYFIAANPAANCQFVRNVSGATAQAFMTIGTTGKITCSDSAAGSAVSTNSIATNQLIRIEYHILHSATVGIVECKLFNTATSTTATETITLSSANTGTSSSAIIFGNSGANSVGPFWMDDIISNTTGYPGPEVNYPRGFFQVI